MESETVDNRRASIRSVRTSSPYPPFSVCTSLLDLQMGNLLLSHATCAPHSTLPNLKTGFFSYSGEFQMLIMFIAAVGGVALFIFLNVGCRCERRQ